MSRDPAMRAQTDNMIHQLNKIYPKAEFNLSQVPSVGMYTLTKFCAGLQRRTTVTTRPLVSMYAFVDGLITGSMDYMVKSRPYRCTHLQNLHQYEEPPRPVEAPKSFRVITENESYIRIQHNDVDILLREDGPKALQVEYWADQYPNVSMALDRDGDDSAIYRQYLNFEV